MARHPFIGASASFVHGATLEGHPHVLGVVESSVQILPSVRGLFQDLLDCGLSADKGLLCITPGTESLSWILTECIGSQI